MKILHCKIENFGKLQDVVFDFSGGANVFCHENGWGKSTLAAFIRIMFFGFENPNKQDRLVNERKRFTPWQGGIYGGSITFEAGGKEYTMRRVFGKKEKDDEFELREVTTNLPSDDYTKQIGEELFGIDGTSFQRTVFISQQKCETNSTDGINAKLGNLVENTDDINNFQAVYAKLKDQTNKMVPTRKTGSLHKEKLMIADMENELRKEEGLLQSVREVEELRRIQVEKGKHLSEEIQIWQNRQSKLSENLDLSVKKKEYETIQTVCQEAEETLSLSKAKFPDATHIPSSEQVTQWQALERQCEDNRDGMLKNQLSEEELTSYDKVKKLLKDQIPTEEDMEQIESAREEYDELNLKLLSGRLTPAEEREWDLLGKKYRQGLPTDEEAQHMWDTWEDVQRRQGELNSKKMLQETLANVSGNRKFFSFVPMCTLLLCAVMAGLAMGILIHPAAGLAGAAALGIAALIIFIKGKREPEQGTSLAQFQQEIEADEAAVQEGIANVVAFLQHLGIDCQETDVRKQLGILRNDISRYHALDVRQQPAADAGQITRYNELQKILAGFMTLYYQEGVPEGQWASRLTYLKEQVHNYHRWQPRVEQYRKEQEKYEVTRRLLEEQLGDYHYEVQNPVSDQLQEIREQVSQYVQAKETYNMAVQRKADFERKNNIEKLNEVPVEQDTLSELHTKLEQCLEEKERTRKGIAEYDNQLQELQEQLDEIVVLKTELEERREKFQEGMKKYELLLKTMEFLKQAKETLTTRYMGPVQCGFEKYYTMMHGKNPSRYRFDASAVLTVDELGMSREIRFLSEGCQDLAGICTRMAFIDAMYVGEKPFIILDDPFVNLDDEKTERALVFLQEFSREYQVIYFTCHQSLATINGKSI